MVSDQILFIVPVILSGGDEAATGEISRIEA